MATFKTEFPDFPAADFPAELPAGFVDTSWHNDVCPSIGNEASSLNVFIDYANPAERELDNVTRYRVTRFNPDTDMNHTDLLASDNWSEVVAFINADAARLSSVEHAALFAAPKPADMRVLFTSDKIAAAPGKLSALISAFDAARPGRGWQYYCNETDMRAELESRGYYTGHNDSGHYLVVNLDLLRVEPHPSFEDENGGKGRIISASLFA